MCETLTKNQYKFVEAYLVSRDAKNAAITAGYSESFAKKKAYMLLKDEKIIECMNRMENDFFRTEFSRLAYKSVTVLEEIMMDYALEERVRLQAVKEVLNFYGLEKRLEMQSNTAKESSGVSIVFNEVPSREITK
jgi:phage terminase small subunit